MAGVSLPMLLVRLRHSLYHHSPNISSPTVLLVQRTSLAQSLPKFVWPLEKRSNLRQNLGGTFLKQFVGWKNDFPTFTIIPSEILLSKDRDITLWSDSYGTSADRIDDCPVRASTN